MSSDALTDNPLRAGMAGELGVAPAALVIFGASGDLTGRKLLPGIYNLARNRLLPSGFALVGFARRPLSDEAFRARMLEQVEAHSRHRPLDRAVWDDLARGMSYVQGSFGDDAAYRTLAARLAELDRVRGTAGGRTFYLAVPPAEVRTIVDALARAGLAAPPARVVVEKPFGVDLASAVELNRELRAKLDERQIFRIDHYLGKETVQNLLVLRFGNTIFEPLWNRSHVSHVELTVAEHIGIEGRGKFYEATGLLRDIVQNHALQLLSLVAMEPPIAWDADAVRDEKVKVLRALRPMRDAAEVARRSVRAQYAAGVVRGDQVSGYREEPDVARDSTVETYVALEVAVENWRWAGVPFFLRAGKRLAKRVTEIAIHFAPLPHPLFRNAPGAMGTPNTLILRIQPDEGIALRFATKIPGQAMALRDVAMDFRYGTAFGHETPEAYERLLLDAMRGDATLFTRHDEAEMQWAYVDPILHAWRNGEAPLDSYTAGSWGPEAAERLISRAGFDWSKP
ncbi:MAG: glucose-6-phosphate dehydrogenase [Sorangiineae bacterium]|nr:glucose-6-phosphate dehydrogenase [Polyangiaceae bacterium]MEB2324262.1 glucose-6-phosphate dehydrogenase [Sorangiineae bacterium]